MNDSTLNVELRDKFGKNESNRIRQAGFIPAVLYSHGNSESIKVPAKAFSNIFKGHISESKLLNINIANKKEDASHQAFVKDYNADPVSGEILHLDFYKITAGEKIRTMVAIEFTGTPAGVKTGGIIEIFERELEVECLPKDLREHIVVDISSLEIGDTIHISDVKIEESIKLLGVAEKPVVSVIAPHVKEEVAEEAEEEVEGEAQAEESAEDESKESKE